MSVLAGDSFEINVFGYITKGYVLSHFVFTRIAGSDEVKAVSWMLIDKNNKIVCFRESDIVHTTRVVLTEKVKYPVKLNKEFNEIMYKAERELRNKQYMFKYRRTGMNAFLSENVLKESIFQLSETEISGIPR